MGTFLGDIGRLWTNGLKGFGSMLGFDTSSYENDEAQRFQAEQAQINRDFQREMLDKEMAYQTDMWNKTNKYNSASEQMKRYREAGLNPYLMMTNGASAGVATSQNSPTPAGGSSPTGGFNTTNPGSGVKFLDYLLDRKVKNATAENVIQDTTTKKIDNMYRETEILQRIAGNSYDNKTKRIVSDLQYDLLNSVIKENKAMENSLNSQAAFNVMDTIYKGIQLPFLPAQLKANIAHTLADTNLLKNLSVTEGYKQYHIMADVVESSAREEGISLSNIQLRQATQHLLDIVESNAFWSGWNNFSSGLGSLFGGIGSLGNLKSGKSVSTHYHGGHYTSVYNR